MFKEFGAFIARGSVMDLAVAVIIGAAFGAIVKSLTDDLIMPVIGWLFGGLDFSSHFIVLGPIPATYHGSLTSYAALKAAGVSLFGWGAFVTAAINFVILAFIIFLMVRMVNRAVALVVAKKDAVPAAEPADVALLREIRDELRKKA